MEDKFIILQETECNLCAGSGSEKANFFLSYFHARKENPFLSLQDHERFWLQDFDTPSDICPKCNGKGRVRFEISLEAALEKIAKKSLNSGAI